MLNLTSTQKLLVYGDVEMDILLKTRTAESPDRDVRVDDISFSPGGSAANCAAIAGSLGQSVTFLGSLGEDAWTKPLLRDLQRFGVNTRFVKRSSGSTGTCVAVVDESGERKFYSYRGANESSPPDLPPPGVWKTHHCLHLSGYSFQETNSSSTAWKLLYEAKKHGLAVSLDPSHLFAKNQDANLDKLLSQLDFFFPNREEAVLISGKKDPVDAAHAIRDWGVKTVVVTLGGDGCLLVSDGIEQFTKIDPLGEVVDTTGAGDAFCGGFLTGWLNGLLLVQACKLGNAAAAQIVTRIGAHEHAPSLDDVASILQHNHEDELVRIIANGLFKKNISIH